MGIVEAAITVAQLLAGQQPEDAVAKESREEARDLVTVQKNYMQEGTGAWNAGSAQVICSRMLQLIDSPWLLNQASTPWCNPAAFLHVMLRRWPKTTAQWAMDLLEHGHGRLKDLQINPNAELLGFDYASQKTSKYGNMANADWMMLASLCDFADPSNDFNGSFDQVQAVDDEDVTEAWLENSGLYNDVDDKFPFSTPLLAGDWDDFFALRPGPDNDIIVVGPTTWFEQAIPNHEELPRRNTELHAVVLLTRPTKVPANPPSGSGTGDWYKVSFVFSCWGIKQIAMEKTMQLEREFTGALVATHKVVR